MRAVADALHVTPMALYHHVADKTAMVALLVERVMNERPLPPMSGDWREDLWQMARWFRQITVAHPAVAELRRVHQVWTPSVLPMTERWFGLWLDSGLGRDDAVLAGSTTSMAIIGVVAEEQLFDAMVRPDLEALERTPTARTAFERAPTREAEFELVVRSLIEGVHARLSG
jgi:AcrR family transcriptional regulator